MVNLVGALQDETEGDGQVWTVSCLVSTIVAEAATLITLAGFWPLLPWVVLVFAVMSFRSLN